MLSLLTVDKIDSSSASFSKILANTVRLLCNSDSSAFASQRLAPLHSNPPSSTSFQCSLYARSRKLSLVPPSLHKMHSIFHGLSLSSMFRWLQLLPRRRHHQKDRLHVCLGTQKENNVWNRCLTSWWAWPHYQLLGTCFWLLEYFVGPYFSLLLLLFLSQYQYGKLMHVD